MNSMDSMEAIAREIFSQVRTTIVLNMRFMDMAVFRLQPVAMPAPLSTDGELLYYEPRWLLKRYRSETTAVARDYLHVLLHCIFRHPFVNTLVNQQLWDLACDIAVEGLICELDQPFLAVRLAGKRKAIVDSLRAEVSPLTAEKLYHHFQQHLPNLAWAGLFHADDHSMWHNPSKASGRRTEAMHREQQQSGGAPHGQGPGKDTREPDAGQDGEQDGQGPGQDNAPDGQNTGQAPSTPDADQGSGQASSTPDAGQSGGPGGSGAGSGSQSFTPTHGAGQGAAGQPARAPSQPDPAPGSRQALEEEWRDISEHVQMDLETFAREQGLEAGGLQQLLSELNRERYDYGAFLKKFAVMGEVMKINDDEFDCIFYTYGLKRYGNMPLIEPLEYKEVRRIRDFVIAIDTSGSTSGELVNRFLTKTYNILMSTESFFSKVNIHIIQCDAEIQEAVKITRREEFETYLEHMTVRGLGGTDFRPVFQYVDQLVRGHEFRHLKGLIYFTDGCGTFPERKPDYQTAFVFVQDQYNSVDVPPWAIRLILEKEEI